MKSFVFVCALLAVATARKLPPSFKRCDTKKDFNACLSVAIPDAVRQLTKPMRRIGLPSVDPLVIPAISIGPGSGPTGFEQNYTDFKISGFIGVSCPEINADLESLNMTMRCFTPQLKIDTNYVFNGTMVVMDMYGNGTGTIILDEVQCYHTYNFEEYNKRGRRHLRATSSTLEVTPRKMSFNFENLYDGQELLATNMNLVMNDNWREIWTDLKPKYEEVFRRVIQALMNAVFSRVPVSDIFING